MCLGHKIYKIMRVCFFLSFCSSLMFCLRAYVLKLDLNSNPSSFTSKHCELQQVISPSHLHSLANNICVYACAVTSVVSEAVQPCGLQPSRLLHPWNSPGKNTGVGCHALFQEIFPEIEPVSLVSPALVAHSLPLAPPGKP